MARAEICRGEHWLLGLVKREDTKEADSSQILQISDGESDMSHLCSTKVPWAAGGEGLRGSKARWKVALVTRDMVVGMQETMNLGDG